MSVLETLAPASDDDRRAKLKAFLINCRSRLTPQDVGLPSTSRRRVVGLRREEVSELVGVSSDWYRWFESGRSIRVSFEFVSRVADTLRLNRDERAKLFMLALPEVAAAIGPSLQSASAALLDSIRNLRKVVCRECSGGSVSEILTAVTESVTEHFRDADMVGVYQRFAPGQWDCSVVSENGRLPTRAQMGDADCLLSQVKSRDGVEVMIFVSYLTERKRFTEYDRTLLGLFADLTSLATRCSN